MKFDFTCHQCNTAFSIGTTYLLKKEKVECPSCGLAFNDDLLNDLKSVASSTEKYISDQRLYKPKIGEKTLNASISVTD